MQVSHASFVAEPTLRTCPDPVRPGWFGLLRLVWFCVVPCLSAEELSDRPLKEPVRYPEAVSAWSVDAEAFASLHMELLAGNLHVFWENPDPQPGDVTELWVSTGLPGHWPARDWRRRPMIQGATRWQATWPVEDVDVPLIYFVATRNTGEASRSLLSPMRLAMPRGLGLSQPTRPFWAFLDGFEEGLDGWRLLSEEGDQTKLALSPDTRNGKAALAVPVPEGKRSAVVATTRVRGWHMARQGAIGLSVWMKTAHGSGRVLMTLHGNALTDDQIVAPCRKELVVGPDWQRVEVLFEDFRDPPLATLDLVSFECVAEGPNSFLLDDLQLLGPWPLN